MGSGGEAGDHQKGFRLQFLTREAYGWHYLIENERNNGTGGHGIKNAAYAGGIVVHEEQNDYGRADRLFLRGHCSLYHRHHAGFIPRF